MKILHIYSGNMYGGVETLLTALARQGGAPADLESEFALCFEGRLADELRDAGAAVHRLAPARFSRPWTVLEARRRLRRTLRAARPDAVVCHSCWSLALLGPTARRAGVPLAFWLHDVARGRHWLERRASRVAPDLAIVCSRFNADSPRRLFGDVVPVGVVPPPVPPPPEFDRAEARAAIRRELRTNPDAVAIVHVSRMEPLKGQGLLLEALALLKDTPGWTAWLAGGAQRPHELTYLDGLQARARAAGIADRLRFAGQRSDVPRLLAAADIHCQPNTAPDAFGIAWVEALDARLPVVTTRMGGAAEIVTDACGVLVPPADPAALADALADLIADPAARARLGDAGPPRARALCDPAAVLRRLRGLLDGLRPAATTAHGDLHAQP